MEYKYIDNKNIKDLTQENEPQSQYYYFSNESMNLFKHSIEENSLEKFTSFLNAYKPPSNILNHLLQFCFQNYQKFKNISNFIKILLSYGANLNIEIENISPLLYSCKIQDFKLTQLILQNSQFKNINISDKNGKNALFYSLLFNKNDDSSLIKLLISKGININSEAKIEINNKIYTHSPLSLATNNNMLNCFKELLNNGADPNYKVEPDGDTILHLAAKNINHEMVKELLKIKNINLEEKNKEGKTARDLALETEQDSNIYNLIVEKISEMDISERKKSDDASYQYINQSKNNIVNNNNNNSISDKNEKQNQEISICNDISVNKPKNNIHSLKKKFIINKYKYDQSKFKNNLKIYINYPKNLKNDNNNSNKLVDYLYFEKNIENDPNENNKVYITPSITIDLLSKQFIDYKNNLNSDNNEKNKITLNVQENKIKKLEEENTNLKNKIEKLTNENKELIEKLSEKEKYILDSEKNKNELMDQLNKKIKELDEELKHKNSLLTELENNNNELNEKLSNIEKNNNKIANTNQIIQSIRENKINYSNYLKKKFINFDYDKDYMIKSLSIDITDFEIFVNERIQIQQNIYDTLINNVQIAVDKSNLNYKVNLYGSHATNLCLPWSDLDVVLVNDENKNSTFNNNNINNIHLYLSKLYEYLRCQEWVKESKFISTASVPIIKLLAIEKYNNMSIDISIQDERHFGLKCVELVKKYLNEYDCLKPLVLAIKNILKRANLNDPYKGGISSYGLILMIIYFLQKQKSMGMDISLGENGKNLGRLFLEFIKFYCVFFESESNIIYIKKDENDNFRDFNLQNINHISSLIIIDPLNHNNNVAKSCNQFLTIKITFILCLMTLQEDCECGCHYNQLGESYDNLEVEHCFLKRIFNSVKRYNQ